MLTSLRKYTLQEEGYTARNDGAACPYELHSDEWHHWRTGWLMRRYQEEEPLADILLPDTGRLVQEIPPLEDEELLPSPLVDDVGPAQGFVCPACKKPLGISPPAYRGCRLSP